MQVVISVSLLIAGIIHLLPLSGVFGADRLTSLYGVDFSDPNLEILMRHRAILFGLLGCLMISSIFRPSLHWIAVAAGLISTISFLLLAWSAGGYNSAISRVVVADIVAIVCLIIAGSAIYLKH